MSIIEDAELTVGIQAGRVDIEGELALKKGAAGIVVFAHGSGSSRLSPRNNFVAEVLRKAGLCTLLIDLLSREEDRDHGLRFDIDLLAGRLLTATRWLLDNELTRDLAVGYFGASTGAAAAVKAAVGSDAVVGAIVSRGGRVDLADEWLDKVTTPTLLIVGAHDDLVVELNRQAYAKLNCVKKMVVVAGATHLFEEPGTLEQVAELSAGWFARYIGRDDGLRAG